MSNTGNRTIILKTDDKDTKKATLRGFILGAVIGGTVVACIKDDSDTVKEIGSTVTKIATSYYGCKLLYQIFS